MIWEDEHQFLLGCLFLFSSAVSMILIAGAGYFMAKSVYEIYYAQKEEDGQSSNPTETTLEEEAD